MRSVFAPLTGLLSYIDEVVGIPPVERYTYVFDNDAEQLDYAFVSPGIVEGKISFEHVHVNNWAPSFDARISDHDPSVGKITVC